jgi:cellulose synthase/poly-beta-1,6-N-acetylglucosamine synthase-like glycosyltransferase
VNIFNQLMTLNLASWIIFELSVLALAYAYVGYPLLVYLISALRPLKVHKKEHYEPTVSLIIVAYNEEKDLRAKLENTLALDYPKEKLEVIVASDCSTDRTDEIALEFASRGVRLHRQPERLGKTPAQNVAVELAQNEIILFSDATTAYEPNVLREMMPSFADETVGCVAGKLIYVDPAGTGVGRGARSYWNYETFLKQRESQACSLIGASGCLYAVRRVAYRPMYPEACSDFLIVTKIMEQGLRAVYEPKAVCTEETNRNARKELRMRVRVISQTLTDLWRHRQMMNPFRSGFYAIQLISHKLFRYFVPFMLLGIFVSTLALARHSLMFRLLFIAQASFYIFAVIAFMLERAGVRVGLLSLPQYFVLTNLASVIALYKTLRGERFAKWEPIREEPATKKKDDAQVATATQGHDFKST